MSLTKASYSMITGAPVNILDYGADPTGTTDSAAAINAAIDTGKSVYIPAGTYLISAAITPGSYQTIYGEGPKQSKLKATTVGMTMIDYPSGSYSNVEILELGIDGDNKALRGISLIGSGQGAVSYCHFSRLECGNCTLQNFYFRELTACYMDNLASVNGYGGVPEPDYAIFFHNCYNTYVRDSLFTSGHISTCGIFAGSQVVLQNVYMYNNGGGADSLLMIDGGFEHSFIDCTFEPQGALGTTVAVVELKQTSSDANAQMANINFVRCYWAGLAGTAPYNVEIGTVGSCYKTKFNECVFVKQGSLVPSIKLDSQAYTSIENCVDQSGYFGLTYYDVTVDNTSGNSYYHEGLPGYFTTSVVSQGSIIGQTISPTTYLAPQTDNTVACGMPLYRWTVVYAATGTINTSDGREKQQVRELSEAEKAVAIKCKSLIRAFKFNDSVESKGDNARIHFGVVAQDIKVAFESEGLNADDYGIFCYDEWEADPEKGIKAGDRYGVRYEELFAFILGAM